MDKPVIVYSQTSGWLFCERVKEFLSQRGIPYVERDVLKDERAMEELSELGYMTTPVVKVGDEVVVGFNRKRLEELLA